MTHITLDPAVPRTVRCLNFDWLFRRGPAANAHERHVDDRGWAQVQLPHDAAVGGEFDWETSTSANGWLPFGAGAYRKHFHLPAEAEGRRVLVQFEGVYRDAEVWVNGQYLGRHLNGYLGFESDLTPHVEFGAENVLTVAYDNRKKGTSRWYTGEGIYRDVWLQIVDPLHVPLNGTYITTPAITGSSALVEIETEVLNLHQHRRVCRLSTNIMGPAGAPVAAAEAVAPIAPGETYTFRQQIEIPAPRLWDLGAPNLYAAVSRLHSGDCCVDSYATRFGIRDIRMTPDRGLLLNGRKVVAKGGNLHHDLGCLGSAVLKRECERRLEQLRDIGCNSFRLSHNPHAPAFLDVCDEKGILIFNEAYDTWTSQFYGGEASFESQWQADLERFIRRDRNHPCVYIWSLGNEVPKQQGRHEPAFETREDAADYGVGLVQRMAALTRRLDPSRKVTVGLFPARAGFIKEWEHWDDRDRFRNSAPAEMAFHVDVVSWNYTENMFALDHARYPQLMFIASESACSIGLGDRLPSWAEIDTDYVIGHYHWSAYDYLGESERPKKVWGRALIDLSGWVTPLGRYYQSCYSHEPIVHIMVYETDEDQWARFNSRGQGRWDWYPMADHWSWGDRKDAKLTTFTNAEEVELILNGRALGKQKLADCPGNIMDWELPYAAGTLTAIARNGNDVVAEHTLRTPGEPVALRLTPHRAELAADGLDVACIEAALTDADGCLVPVSGTTVTFQVDGPAVNAGVANGDVVSDEPWQADARSTWNGRCILLIRAGRTTGEAVITATAEGYPSSRCSLRVGEPRG